MNVLPTPGDDCTSISPSCADTMRCEIANPKPVQPSLVVQNGMNNRGTSSGGMPTPVSATAISTAG